MVHGRNMALYNIYPVYPFLSHLASTILSTMSLCLLLIFVFYAGSHALLRMKMWYDGLDRRSITSLVAHSSEESSREYATKFYVDEDVGLMFE